jgi:glycosyltransferase involved in cell wall biosynthesis
MVKISVGISFYNTEKYLKDAIVSVLNQTYKNFELILIDDGSTDESLKIAKSFKDSRIRLIESGKNLGLAKRLNQLTRESSGEYIARMDADDIMDVTRLEEQLNYIESHKDIDVLGSFAYSIDANNNITGFRTKPNHPCTVEEIMTHASFIHPSIIAKRQWFIDNPYDENALRMEDFNLWMRTFEKSYFYNMENPLMFYREVGIPYLSKYLQSMKGERREYRRARNQIKNFHKAMLFNYIKCSIYIIASVFGFRNFIISLRAKHICDMEIINMAKCRLD